MQDNGTDSAAVQAGTATEDEEKERLAERRRNFSSKRSATASYGTTAGASDASLRRRGLHRRSSVILKRTGSTGTTDQPFDRQHSIPSLRSSTSIRTRIASISRSEYHEDLKPILTAVSIIVAINQPLLYRVFQSWFLHEMYRSKLLPFKANLCAVLNSKQSSSM